MSATTAATIEELIYLSVEEGGTLTQHEADDLLAELAELRRKAAVYAVLAAKVPTIVRVAEKEAQQ